MHAHCRASYPRSELEPLSSVRDAADDGPHKRTLPLRICPGMEVVGDGSEREPMFFGQLGILHQIIRRVFLTR
jgi:hypothetical protein